MPAVNAIASAPQKVTRSVARPIAVPPTFAPIASSKARNDNEVDATIGATISEGVTATIASGKAAPAVNVAADVIAACNGLDVVSDVMASSSCACAWSASLAINWVATWSAVSNVRPRWT
jgi:hypothetical protein